MVALSACTTARASGARVADPDEGQLCASNWLLTTSRQTESERGAFFAAAFQEEEEEEEEEEEAARAAAAERLPLGRPLACGAWRRRRYGGDRAEREVVQQCAERMYCSGAQWRWQPGPSG